MDETTIIIKGDAFYEKREQLKLIKQLNWENYYYDEKNGEKWVEEYPHSALQAGGEAQFKKLGKFPWE